MNASPLETVLNQFAQRYLSGVRVKLDARLPRKAGGESDIERKIIRLSPRQQVNADAIALGLSYAYRIGPKYRKMKLGKNEILFPDPPPRAWAFQDQGARAGILLSTERSFAGARQSIQRRDPIDRAVHPAKERRVGAILEIAHRRF